MGKILQTIYPGGFKEECKQLLILAVPTGLAICFLAAVGPISLMFCGHLSRDELDGVALAISMFNITGFCVGLGLTSACSTFFSQGFGSNNKKIVGVHVQRSVLVTSLGSMATWCINLNAESLLRLLGQDKHISRIAGRYLLCVMPANIGYKRREAIGRQCPNVVILSRETVLFLVGGSIYLFIVWMDVAMKFMLCQNSVIPSVIIGAIGSVCNVLAHYIAMHVFHFRTESSALCLVLSFFVMMVASVTYILVTGFHKAAWDGFSWRALEDWGIFARLALGGLVMLGADWWLLEVGIWLNGLVGKVQLAATSVTFQILTLTSVIGIGLAVSANVRVGQHLGSGSPVNAKNAYRVSLTTTVLCFLGYGTLTLSLKDYLPRVFSDDSEVVDMAAKNFPVLYVLMFLDGISMLSGGAMRGCGQQWTGAAIIGACYILLALPICCILIFVAKLGSIGFFGGVTIGALPMAVIFTVMLYFTDWDDEAEKLLIFRIADFRIVAPNSDLKTMSKGNLSRTTAKQRSEDHVQRKSFTDNEFVMLAYEKENDSSAEETDALIRGPVQNLTREEIRSLILKRCGILFLVLGSIGVAGMLRVLCPVPG